MASLTKMMFHCHTELYSLSNLYCCHGNSEKDCVLPYFKLYIKQNSLYYTDFRLYSFMCDENRKH